MPDATLKSGPHRKSLEAGCVSGAADEQRLAERNPREQSLQSNTEQPGSRSCRKPLYNSRSSTRRFIRHCLVCVFVRVSSAGPPPFSFSPRAILLSFLADFRRRNFFSCLRLDRPLTKTVLSEILFIEKDSALMIRGFVNGGMQIFLSDYAGRKVSCLALTYVRMYVSLFVPLT